jgi:bifunctional non-homologous end joining protein LigD
VSGARATRSGDLLEEARTWRPMRPAMARRPRPVEDPIVEPLWSGARAICVVGALAGGARDGTDRPVALLDHLGVDLALDLPALAAELGAAVLADDAVVDVVITPQVTVTGEGTAVISEAWLSQGRLLLSGDAGIDVRRRGGEPVPQAAGPGFACVDLLACDGQSLLDVPLLERKRLLESVILASERVRVSVHTRPPIDAWIASWKSLGLRGAMVKAANSRYHPGERTLQWRTVERIAGRR